MFLAMAYKGAAVKEKKVRQVADLVIPLKCLPKEWVPIEGCDHILVSETQHKVVVNIRFVR